MPSYSVLTFGCQMNQHDSQRMEEVLRRAGYVNSDDPQAADLIVLNTCSIREKAEQKLRSEVGRMGLLKKKRPDLVLAVAGCVAQQEGERLVKSLPQIDLVLGPDNIPELPRLLHDLSLGGLPQVRTVFDVESPSFLMAAPELGTQSASAYVTVMKGCNERCTYCIVPSTRGPERYRPSAEILAEIELLVRSGVKEITLLGQTVNSYLDPSGELGALTEKDAKPPTSGDEIELGLSSLKPDESQFPDLLRAIAARVPQLFRLRYTSPHPRHLTASLIAAHAELPMLARHVHLPVQSGSDRQLRRMLRRYRREEYLERTAALRTQVPGLTFSTDVIVGFSGETEEDFQQTLDLVEQVGFVSLFGFTYSQRPGTPALKLADDVPEAVKSERLARLFALAERLKLEHLQSRVGQRETVLVDGKGKTGAYSGRTERNEICHLSVPDALAGVEGLYEGAVVEVEVSAAFKNSLAATVLRLVEPSQMARMPEWSSAVSQLLAEEAAQIEASAEGRGPVGAGQRRALPVLGGS